MYLCAYVVNTSLCSLKFPNVQECDARGDAMKRFSWVHKNYILLLLPLIHETSAYYYIVLNIR